MPVIPGRVCETGGQRRIHHRWFREGDSLTIYPRLAVDILGKGHSMHSASKRLEFQCPLTIAQDFLGVVGAVNF